MMFAVSEGRGLRLGWPGPLEEGCPRVLWRWSGASGRSCGALEGGGREEAEEVVLAEVLGCLGRAGMVLRWCERGRRVFSGSF